MVSLQDLQYSLQLYQISNQIIPLYYAYIIPWMTIACNLFALSVLFFRKRTGTGNSSGQDLVILIFKWQYFSGLMYTLNMILNDNTFSQILFNYVSTKYVEDYVCKIHLVLMKYFYCMAPWMQVIVTFDRLWSVIFANKWKLKRSTKTVTLLILTVQGLVLLINLFYLTYYASSSLSSQLQYDPVLNTTTWINTTQLNCMVINKNIQTAQDMLYVIMRIVLPLLIMATCSVVLIKHVREAKRRIVRGRNQKRENHFTVAVAFTNVAFLLFNLPVTVYYVIYYYVSYAKVSFSFLGSYQFNLFFVCAYLFSYMFTMAQFWIDLAFNRLFRNEIFAVFRLLFPRAFNRVGVSENQNNSVNNTK